MAGRDKTGPMGKGEATGRGLGNCEVAGEQEQRPGLGQGRGQGCRRGAGREDKPGRGRNQAGGRGRGLGR